MIEQINKVKEFNLAFNSLVSDKPCLIGQKDYELRFKLMEEENQEYLQACIDKDLVEIGDALGDKLYILLGTILSHGMQDVISEVFTRIHESNMSKLENGKPVINGENGVFDSTRPLGKVLKGKSFKPVDLKDIYVTN